MLTIGQTAKDLDLAYNTVASAVQRLENLDLLFLEKEQGRNRLYVYKDYLDILRTGTEIYN